MVPGLYRPLMEALKSTFLDTACRYAALRKYDGQYASLLFALHQCEVIAR